MTWTKVSKLIAIAADLCTTATPLERSIPQSVLRYMRDVYYLSDNGSLP